VTSTVCNRMASSVVGCAINGNAANRAAIGVSWYFIV
jgi:hypothetical protein